MSQKLPSGRNELDGFICSGTDLTQILIEGRFLQTDAHDTSGEEHCHWHRKILETYNTKKGVLLSKEGSLNSPDNLNIKDKYFSLKELYDTGIAYWMVREKGWKLF